MIKNLFIKLPVDTHKKFKVLAAEENITMKDLLILWIEEKSKKD